MKQYLTAFFALIIVASACTAQQTNKQSSKQSEKSNAKPTFAKGKTEISINEYFNSNYKCPNCSSAFNPKCSNHNHLYFDVQE